MLAGKVIQECEHADSEGEHSVKAFISLNNNVLSGYHHHIIDSIRNRLMNEARRGLERVLCLVRGIHMLIFDMLT